MTLQTMAAILLALAGSAAANTITVQSGISEVQVAGVRVAEQSDAQTGGRVSVAALHGTLTTPEARTAARSSADEIASNVKFDDHIRFSRTDFFLISQASYQVRLEPITPFTTRARVDFFLPPSYMEITSNAETFFNEADALLIAELSVCLQLICSPNDPLFRFQANMTATFREYSYSQIVEGHPSLNLDPLRNPSVRDVQGAFYRTTTIEYPEFHGTIDLGLLPVGERLTLDYILQTRVSGLAITNIAIAAINDPFTLDTDPVQRFQTASVTLLDEPSNVPEPSTFVLTLIPLLLPAMRGFVRKS